MELSRLKINIEKSSILLSRNVPKHIKQDVISTLPYTVIESFNRYLGLPLVNGKKHRVGDYQFLIDKMNSKLAGWKARDLSMAGRLV